MAENDEAAGCEPAGLGNCATTTVGKPKHIIARNNPQDLSLPRRFRGRLSPAKEAAYRAAVSNFCGAIRKINSTLDFRATSRGWAYILEEYGLGKGDLDTAQQLISECRKSRDLPINICAEDENRTAENIAELDDDSPEEFAARMVGDLKVLHHTYNPIDFWDGQKFYLEMMVEKVDLKNLLRDICRQYCVPIANSKGWNSFCSRAALMERFALREAEGKQPVLLHCGDHDPGGLDISEFLRSNFADLERAVGWTPKNLIIDRFGLNKDFIRDNNLTWIENCEASHGAHPLDGPKHPDHRKSYVQSYLARFGARKVEANALLTRPEAGRDLCERAILKYIPIGALERHQQAVNESREIARREISRLVAGGVA